MYKCITSDVYLLRTLIERNEGPFGFLFPYVIKLVTVGTDLVLGTSSQKPAPTLLWQGR